MAKFGITKEQKTTVAVLLCGAVLVVLNQTMLSPALPSIMSHMSVDATTVQWLTSAYSLVEAVMIPLSAWFMGRVPFRKLFCGLMGLFCAGSVVAAIAPVFAVLLLGRVLQAAATGVMMVAVMSTILLTFPRESRGAAMGLVGLVISFAPAVGPTCGGILVDVVGWRALFCISASLSVLVILFAVARLGQGQPAPEAHFDALSVVLSSIGLVALLYGLSSFASSGQPVLCAVLIVVGITVVGLFARRQLSLTEPMLRIEVLKSSKYRHSIIVLALLQALLIGVSVLMPLYIQNVLGYSATISGLVILPGALASAAFSLIGGRVFDRSGVRRVALVSASLMFVGAFGMCFYAIDSSLVLVIIANLLFCASLQMLFTPVNTWGVNSLENRLVQHATAVTNTMNQVGASLGTALIMSFAALGSSMALGTEGTAQVFAGYHVSFIVVGVLAAGVLAVVVTLVREPTHKNVVVAPSKEGLGYKVREVMLTNPTTIPADATLGQAVHALAEANASGIPLVYGDGTLAGFLSNSDVLRLFSSEAVSITGGGTGISIVGALVENEDVRESLVRLSDKPALDFATRKVVGVSPDTSFEDACGMLAEKRLKTLPVIEEGRLVGVVRRSSLMSLFSNLLQEA